MPIHVQLNVPKLASVEIVAICCKPSSHGILCQVGSKHRLHSTLFWKCYMDSMKLLIPSHFISWKKTQKMLLHCKVRVNSHQRWKVSVVPHLLSSLLIYQYNKCNGITSLMEFMINPKEWSTSIKYQQAAWFVRSIITQHRFVDYCYCSTEVLFEITKVGSNRVLRMKLGSRDSAIWPISLWQVLRMRTSLAQRSIWQKQTFFVAILCPSFLRKILEMFFMGKLPCQTAKRNKLNNRLCFQENLFEDGCFSFVWSSGVTRHPEMRGHQGGHAIFWGGTRSSLLYVFSISQFP